MSEELNNADYEQTQYMIAMLGEVVRGLPLEAFLSRARRAVRQLGFDDIDLDDGVPSPGVRAAAEKFVDGTTIPAGGRRK